MTKGERGGIISWVLIIIILVLVVTYFGINIRQIVETPAGQDNFTFLKEIWLKIWTFLQGIWNSYLSSALSTFWHNVVIPYIWDPILQNIDKMHK